eukprot:TRINITY_DN5806_c0_g4_i1.p1 TRINITY_DN5806_c0_g4~~TRINITY_DN5806_c0_g4_i1.p1  ORF type:complete len:551 (-),score=79.41 TRINITY_DN5806_c0_g4_i1:884-2536(-)
MPDDEKEKEKTGDALAIATRRSGRGSSLRAISASKLFFKVRDEVVSAVIKALEYGLLEPESKYPPDDQNLMFFAAARSKKLGGSEVIARRLSELGVPQGSTDYLKQTPLFFAAREGNTECAAFLIEKRCDVNHRDINGQTPLFYSFRESHRDMCQTLISMKASLDVQDKFKKTVFSYAKDPMLMLPEQLRSEVPGHPLARGRKNAPTIPLIQSPAIPSQPIQRQSLARGAKSQSKTELVSTGKELGNGTTVVESISSTLSLSEKSSSSSSAAAPSARKRQRPSAAYSPELLEWIYREKESKQQRKGSTNSTSSQNQLDDSKVLTQLGEYYICVPSVSDAVALRLLEREFVFDHYDMFVDEAWHKSLTIEDWCDLVNVLYDDDQAMQAIVNIISGRKACHQTVMCVHRPDPNGPYEVVGYAHIFCTDYQLDISHLKVSRDHCRRGLGCMLMAGSVRRAANIGWDVRELSLVVVSRNTPAKRLYENLSFKQVSTMLKPASETSGDIEWIELRRNLRVAIKSGAFLNLCVTLAKSSSNRGPDREFPERETENN